MFELKTVQVLYGEQLGIQKPCIWTGDEAYNIEWSSELPAQAAADEYIRAYIILHLLAREFGLDGKFQFHASVGYNLEGIQSPAVDGFLNAMRDASGTAAWKQAMDWTLAHLDLFEHVDAGFVRGIDPCVTDLVTLSTMHGCPADEIERIASYLLTEKGFHTYIKCNPTLIGYDRSSPCSKNWDMAILRSTPLILTTTSSWTTRSPCWAACAGRPRPAAGCSASS